jgi:hypothetical protein
MAESDAKRAAREERERAATLAHQRQAEADRATALDVYGARYAAAIAVLNIKVLVPLVLDRAADNYNRWHALFLTVLGKYALTDHVLSDVVNADCPAWVQMNCTMLTWIYGTIHADLQQSTMNRKPNARGAWTYLENEFLGQRESRALLLSAEFHTAKQGSSSITDYCRASRDDGGDPRRLRRSDWGSYPGPYPPPWSQWQVPAHGLQPQDAAALPHLREGSHASPARGDRHRRHRRQRGRWGL